ncbi:hypothetical protein Tco_0438078 [Tanacetum coccineum]
MAEELDEQQRQQVMLDAALVPINEQILKQYSFYNVLIATKDALEIYMQQFWYTITQELMNPTNLDHPFTPLTSEKEIIRFINKLGWKASAHDRLRFPMLQLLWGMVTDSNIDFAKLIWADFKHQIRTRRDSKLKQELMPYPRFTKLIVKYVMSKNDKIPKRPPSSKHIIKLDTKLGNLKFANKGTIDPVFGMPNPAVMLNDDIKTSAKYSKYLKKAVRGSTHVVKGGKRLLSKKGVEIETGDGEVKPLIRHRSTDVTIGSKSYRESIADEQRVDHPMKLKGLETLSIDAQIKLDMKKAQKASKDDFYIQQRSKGSGERSGITLEVPDELVHKSSNEGAGVNPEVPDKSKSSSSSSSSDSEAAVEDILSNDDEVTKKVNEVTEKDDEVTKKAEKADEVTKKAEKADEVKKADVEKITDEQMDRVEPEVQLMVDVPVKQAKPAALRHPLIDTTMTIIPDTTNDDESLENIVYRLERQVDALSKFNIQEAVDKFVEARLKQIDFSKDVPNFGKIKQEKAAKQSMPKHLSTKFNKAVLAMYDQKDKLYKMIDGFKAYNKHPAHKALFNALAVSLSVDEDDMKKKKKDHDVSSSKKTKDQPTSTKGTTPSKSLKIEKTLQEKETIEDPNQEAGMHEEPIVNEKSPRPDSLDPEWSKDPNVDAGQEQDWFLELKKTVKALEEFDDPLGTTFDFSNFVKHHLKKDKLTKADLEGDRILQDLSKPLPLLGALGQLYIPADDFFNKDLEYLRSRNLEERKYTASFTKEKAIRYVPPILLKQAPPPRWQYSD